MLVEWIKKIVTFLYLVQQNYTNIRIIDKLQLICRDRFSKACFVLTGSDSGINTIIFLKDATLFPERPTSVFC
jgi:hypothetical protein